MRGQPPHTTWAALAARMGITICSSKATCPAGLGSLAHRDGRVSHGAIHWEGFRRTRSSTRGLRHFLKLVALWLNPSWEREPSWRRLYLTNVAAYRMARDQYHLRLPAKEARRDMEEILKRTTGLRLRTTEPRIYKWIYRALR